MAPVAAQRESETRPKAVGGITAPFTAASSRARDQKQGADLLLLEPRCGESDPEATSSYIEHLKAQMWRQSVALVARCTQLADLCNKYQQKTDELNSARSEIANLKGCEEKAERESQVHRACAQMRIRALEERLEMKRQKLLEYRHAFTDVQNRLLAAETKLNDAQLFVVIAFERVSQIERTSNTLIKERDRLKAALDLASKRSAE
jgi:hypothetical protein